MNNSLGTMQQWCVKQMESVTAETKLIKTAKELLRTQPSGELAQKPKEVLEHYLRTFIDKLLTNNQPMVLCPQKFPPDWKSLFKNLPFQYCSIAEGPIVVIDNKPDNYSSCKVFGASLSKPHTSWKIVCTSITYTDIANDQMQCTS